MFDGIIILGAGGHAKVIADIILRRGVKFKGFLDDNVTGEIFGYPVLGMLADAGKYRDKCSFIIGIGNNQTRKKIVDTYDLCWFTAIHPDATVAKDTVIGEGTVVTARAVINPSATIGRHCIINSSAVLEHDCTVGDYVHVAPNATLCGTVSVGGMTQIGAGATVKNNTTVCADCIVGSGAVVTSNITEGGVYVGVPARRIVKN